MVLFIILTPLFFVFIDVHTKPERKNPFRLKKQNEKRKKKKTDHLTGICVVYAGFFRVQGYCRIDVDCVYFDLSLSLHIVCLQDSFMVVCSPLMNCLFHLAKGFAK